MTAGEATALPERVDVATLRRALKAVGSVRTTIGLLALVAPGPLGAAWIGADARRPGVRMLVRAFGIREIVVGAGAITAANEGRQLRRWAELGMVVDGFDALATLLAARHLGPSRAVGFFAVGVGGAALGGWLLRELPEEVPSTR